MSINSLASICRESFGGREFAFAANISGDPSFTSSALSPPVATPGDRVEKAALAHSIELPIGWVTIGRTGLPSPPI